MVTPYTTALATSRRVCVVPDGALKQFLYWPFVETHTLDHLHFLSVKGDEDRLKSCQEMIQISTLHVRSVTLVHK